MNTKSLVSSIIHAKQGWAVSEQFDDTFSGNESFEDQNRNALDLIEKICSDLLESQLLTEKPYYELHAYTFQLREHLKN